MFETGSLRHGTGVSGYSDADYIVSLHGERPTPDTALNKVKAALVDKYSSTNIRISRPAVVCEFASGMETIEVVPAYVAPSGYWIADPTGGWMLAYPKAHNSYVTEVNKKHNGGAKKLARLAKVWKYHRDVPVSSCYLEMRAAKYADDETTWSMPLELLRYFNWLWSKNFAAMNDPTGNGARFTACSSDSKHATSISRLAAAIGRARKAQEFYLAGQNASAIQQYKLLFNQ